ncbi:unnamed protein product [Bursaphelenchus okinawaensis]|uniref:Uncharacterized protein n=1 Tax=Bursaphelenchus okinawaensis TaxID=465554 RepID=A0A811KBD5_9BILA|nr:unnamed protein product [Bursaphelenchus okinawaensis]CAG9100873.1 unnamed protein product [Bursaphelenchus okinawaensis]
MQTEKNFFFYDTSITLKDDVHKIVPKEVKEGRSPPFMNFNTAEHSVYATLHPGMLDYLPMPYDVIVALEYQSILFISDSPYTRRFLKWFSLCALTEDCISPPNATVSCDLSAKDRFYSKMGRNCHRFDQNLWNLINLQYLFDPFYKGALRLGLVHEWIDGTANSDDISEFINETITKRDERFLPLGMMFNVTRGNVINRKIKLDC